jgi:CspA family cold shock protein
LAQPAGPGRWLFCQQPLFLRFRSSTVAPVLLSHSLSLSFSMLTGTVKFYNDTKGFGFIIADDTQEEIFVHQTGLIHEIQEGDRVEFNIKAGKKGPNAVEVTRIP